MLLTCYLFLIPLWESVIVLCFGVRFLRSLLVLQSSGWERERELVALLSFVFLVSRDCCVALPRGAMGLSAVCNCGIS